MGNIEDIRKVVQDFVVPDMKAIAARIEALEKDMNLRFTFIEKDIHVRFTAVEQLAASRHETVMAAMTAPHTSIMNALEMEKRLARLESERTKLSEGRTQEQ